MATDIRPDWCGLGRNILNANTSIMEYVKTLPARILIVGSDPNSTILLQTMLETAKFTINTAQDGKDAQLLARKYKPDVIILDSDLLDNNSIEVCREFRQEPYIQPIPVIIAVDGNDTLRKFAGFRAGGTDYIVKPYLQEDVLERIVLQISLSRVQKTFALQTTALDEASELIAIVDAACNVIVANKACETFTGYSKNSLIGRNISFLSIDRAPAETYNQLCEAIISAQPWAGEIQMHCNDGSICILDANSTSFSYPDMETSFTVIIAHDVTESRMRQWDLERQICHDSLTGLMNRKGFMEVLSNYVSSRSRSEDELALLYVDFDKFKMVNDTLGHAVGDALLVQASERIKSCLRNDDLAARIGGDEFVVLLRGKRITKQAEFIANRIIANLNSPFNILEYELAVSASIGISIGSGDDWDSDSLITNADTAMYAAKQSGRNQYISYSDDKRNECVTVLELKRDLRYAEGRGEFEVYYQPIIDIKTMSIAGAEALLRWNHPSRGLISPGVFLPLAEEMDLMNGISDYVLREVCNAAKEWRLLKPFAISMNVSEHQLVDTSYPSRIEKILSDIGLDTFNLCLELGDNETAKCIDSPIVQALSYAGFSIAWNQYGTDLLVPKWLKVSDSSMLKIRANLLEKALENVHERSNLENIITIAHSMGIKVTAEWIETQSQVELVKKIGFDFAQGYAISSPLRASALLEHIQESCVNRSYRTAA